MKSITAPLACLTALAGFGCATAEPEGPPLFPDDPDAGTGTGGMAGAAGGEGGAAGSGTAGHAGSGIAGSGTGGEAASAGMGSGGEAGSAGMAGAAGAAGAAGGSNLTCIAGAIDTEPCGACGERSRLCDTDGTWLDWGACAGEVGECTPGTEMNEPCEKCGTRKRFCSAACIWLPGPCENQGACEVGEQTYTVASCPAGEIRTATCTAQCTLGTLSDCSSQYTWSPVGATSLDGRYSYSYTEHGNKLYVYGGRGTSPTYKTGAAVYDPATGMWTALAAEPSDFVGRYSAAMVHTGDSLILWGGRASSTRDDGARYDFSGGSWMSMNRNGAPSARYNFAYAYDAVSRRLLVWGGQGSDPSYKSDGKAYNVDSDTWTALPSPGLSGRSYPLFAWDDARRRLYVWGGYSPSSSEGGEGGDSGSGGTSYPTDGAYYDAASNSWTQLPATPSGFLGRRYGRAVVASGKLVIWGGGGSSPTYKDDGVIYDPDTNSWTLMPTAPIGARREHLVLTDTSRVFIHGGRGASSKYYADGAVFDPTNNSWLQVPDDPITGALSERYLHGGAWTQEGVVVWGGRAKGSVYRDDGAVFEP